MREGEKEGNKVDKEGVVLLIEGDMDRNTECQKKQTSSWFDTPVFCFA